MDSKVVKRNELIKEQKHLIQLFDKWVGLVKVNDLEGAKDVKELANIIRKTILSLETEIKNERESCIITKLN